MNECVYVPTRVSTYTYTDEQLGQSYAQRNNNDIVDDAPGVAFPPSRAYIKREESKSGCAAQLCARVVAYLCSLYLCVCVCVCAHVCVRGLYRFFLYRVGAAMEKSCPGDRLLKFSRTRVFTRSSYSVIVIVSFL